MVRLEVRCCCVPGRVLGTLQVHPEQAHAWHRLTFVLRPQMSWQEMVKPDKKSDIETIELEVLNFMDDAGRRYPAIQAHEDQLPALRRIPGFTESK